jgi:hypothetical protein
MDTYRQAQECPKAQQNGAEEVAVRKEQRLQGTCYSVKTMQSDVTKH